MAKILQTFNVPSAVTEEFLEKKIMALSTIYKNRAASISRSLKGITLSPEDRDRLNGLLQQVNREVRFLNSVGPQYANTLAKAGYKRGQSITAAVMDQFPEQVILGSIGNLIHTAAVNVIADQMALDLMMANGALKTNLRRYIMSTKQKILEDSTITKAVGEGLISGSSMKQVSNTIYQAMKKKMDGGQFIEVKGRSYDPRYYSELIARTRTREAVTQGAINNALQYGVTLMQVSVHSGSCEKCIPFQGKVYSLTGRDPGFPMMDRRPPFHPNCRHVLLAVPSGALSTEERKTLSNFSSGNKTVTTMADYEKVVNP